MTIGELIKELQKGDPNREVYISVGGSDKYHATTRIKVSIDDLGDVDIYMKYDCHFSPSYNPLIIHRYPSIDRGKIV